MRKHNVHYSEKTQEKDKGKLESLFTLSLPTPSPRAEAKESPQQAQQHASCEEASGGGPSSHTCSQTSQVQDSRL